jgi:hypothetical protein
VKEREWLSGTDPQALVRFIHNRVGPRKPRLFAAACCRRLWHVLEDDACRRAVEVGERLADGLCPREERGLAFRLACKARDQHPNPNPRQADAKTAAYYAAAFAAAAHAPTACLNCSAYAVLHFEWKEPAKAGEERAIQLRLLHDVFGNPFRPPPSVNPAWLDWNGGVVRRLADAAYEQWSLPEGTLDPARLAVLADALEEAGCNDAGLLGHLRSPGPHTRGCFAVDVLLGRE